MLQTHRQRCLHALSKNMKKIFIASDHAGFEFKKVLKDFLLQQGYEVEDCGPVMFDAQDDYPDYVLPCAQKVAEHEGSFGVVLGLSGQGEAMAANRIQGVRAAVYYGGPTELLVLSREHNDANVLSLAAKFLTYNEMQEAVQLWLSGEFSGDERHVRRIKKLDVHK